MPLSLKRIVADIRRGLLLYFADPSLKPTQKLVRYGSAALMVGVLPVLFYQASPPEAKTVATLGSQLTLVKSATRLNYIQPSYGDNSLEVLHCDKKNTCRSTVLRLVPEPLMLRWISEAVEANKPVELRTSLEFPLNARDQKKLEAEAAGKQIPELIRFLILGVFYGGMGYLIWLQLGPLRGAKFDIIMPTAKSKAMEDVIGYQDIKDEIQQIAEIYKHRGLYAEYGVANGFNCLFSGPPGTGKTRMAAALAQLIDAPLISLSGANLETGFVGGGANTLKTIRNKAAALAERHGRCVVFLDEAQNLFMPRGRSDSRFAENTADTLLAVLDGVSVKRADVIWVVASNFDESNMAVDPAMMRRFPLKLFFRVPTLIERKAILTHYLGKTRVQPDLNISSVLGVTEGTSPAMLRNIVEMASLRAARRREPIEAADLMLAWENLHIGFGIREDNPDRQAQRYQVAVHELGHLLIEWREVREQAPSLEAAFNKLKVLKVSTESLARQGALGYVLSSGSLDMLYTKDRLEWQVRKLYGGRAAEQLILGSNQLSVGATNDIEKATEILFNMAEKSALIDIACPVTRSSADEPELREQIQTLARTLYDSTMSLLLEEEACLRRLLPLLMEKHLLTREELKPLLLGQQDLTEPVNMA